MERNRHPSGRPVNNKPAPKGQPIWRTPLDGYVTPRLQRKPVDAIGFVHNFERDEEDNG